MRLTEKQRAEYLKSRGSHCPVCRSANIEAGQGDTDGDSREESVSCLTCGAEWWDIYTLSDLVLEHAGTRSGSRRRTA